VSGATDRIEITELLNRHQIYIDLADAEGYAGLYAPDGAYESPFASATGGMDIAKMFRGLGASGFTANKRHFTGPIIIDVERDRATALSYWWVADYANKPPIVFATGTYKDELQKVDGV
jgi:SnoaL-like domain